MKKDLKLNKEVVYLDTNLFVFAVLENGKAKEILKKLAKGTIKAVTSVITWDEFVWAMKKTTSDYDFAKKEGKRFLFLPNLTLADLNFDIVKKAQDLIENYNLKPRDSLHIATAISKGINKIISDDSDLDNIKEVKRISINEFQLIFY